MTIDGDAKKVDAPVEAGDGTRSTPDETFTETDETHAQSEVLSEPMAENDSKLEKPVHDDPAQDAAMGERADMDDHDKSLPAPAEQPATAAAPPRPADDEPVAGAQTSGKGAEGDSRSGRNSDWSKTGGYQGQAAVTRTPDPVRSTGAAGNAGPDDRTGRAAIPATASAGTTSPSDATGRSGVGFGGALFAGLIGAASALAVAAYLFQTGYFDPRPEEVAAADTTTSQIERLEQELAALRTQVDESTAAAGAQDESVPGLTPEEVNALNSRLQALETSASDAASGQAGAAEAAEDIAELRQTLSETQETASAAQDTATGAQTAAEEAAQSASSAQSSVEALQSSLEETRQTFETRLASIEQRQADASTALAAAGLKSAIDSGGAFETELQNFADAGGAQEATETLRPYAGSGVPTAGMLAERWNDVEGAVSAALTGPGTDAPIGDQVMAGFRSLVETRPSGEIPADATSPDAVIAKLDRAISAGDLQGFVQEWQTLPDDAKQAGSAFFADVEARLAANKALSDAISATQSNGSSVDAPGQNNQG
ncbi:hypothetical protein [Fulvimarina sp. 2208YS6-2-32]|uniref:hypothetical protein n=1 Tax=Fulvimarina uroteuthidis TaxID=3098149 RepID=UPI002AC8ACF5|nr:hypothetical protein [Fulvimarina sp. 2208YS6-2-32]